MGFMIVLSPFCKLRGTTYNLATTVSFEELTNYRYGGASSEELTDAYQEIYHHFVDYSCTLSCSGDPFTGPYSELNASSRHSQIHPALYTMVSSIQTYRPKLRPYIPSLPCALQPLAKSTFLKLLVTQFCKYFCDFTPLRFLYVRGGGA